MAEGSQDGTSEKKPDMMVMYLVCRRDLLTELKWPTGSVLAQAAHASTAVLAENAEHPNVVEYTSPSMIDRMHKVVLEAKNEEEIVKVSKKLEDGNIPYKLW
eukprot:CAMPEP_0113873644 /NCGR_PEP_ID=MMETSP0780_2-20120614/3887_1 /TAXON_ID=652834 /ORGANISM="Palpitomonas bilix" /LENGTH=101 /DNA_ID=CAMNT_0000859317 /DNA_START=56 /DNA_END=358 /DNA_ORIENTATION=+ /assembly_acc=CAM_ASM_000599